MYLGYLFFVQFNQCAERKFHTSPKFNDNNYFKFSPQKITSLQYCLYIQYVYLSRLSLHFVITKLCGFSSISSLSSTYFFQSKPI